jgi:hypothetical protein
MRPWYTLLLVATAVIWAAAIAMAVTTSPTRNMRVDITPTPGIPVPPQATTAGFTTLAFNGDMAASFNVGCVEESGHDWYVLTQRALASSCNFLTWPFNDAGNTVLKIDWTTSAHGSLLGRTGVTTTSDNGTFGRDFPINAYYECITRMTPLASLGPWFNCFMLGRQTIHAPGNQLDNEYDINEFHGGYFFQEEVGGVINWNCGGNFTPTCYQDGAFFGDISNTVPGFDPTQYHKYGMLLKQTSPTNIHTCGYVDDVQMACGDSSLDARERVQRNYLILDVSNSCNFDEGSFDYCMNQSVTSLTNDAGNIRVGAPFPQWFFNWQISISGVTGTTNANGIFNWSNDSLPVSACAPNCTIHIKDKNTNVPIPFGPGPYTGGGVFNAFTGSSMYVKSFRVWSCASWLTTECFP